jgi:hypothetical protein
MIIRRWLFFGFGVKEKIIDPRKINQFIEDVMDPYGRQDKYREEMKQKEDNEEKKREEIEKKKEADKYKLLKLFKNNKELVDQLYDKIEKGDIYAFNKLLEGIPEQYRQATVVSSLDTLFTRGAKNEPQLNKGGFASAWEKLSRQPKAKAALLKYMPENAGQFLDDLALISKQYSTAISSTNRTGIVNAMGKFGSDQGFISKILPMFPYGKKVDEAISLAAPDALAAASNLMQNPDFKRIIINGAKGQPADKIEKTIMDNPAFKVWFELMPANYKSRILSVGLTDYFLGD